MSLPKEPRQKMINMMYLVLTAILALNVSSEILNAFKTVNNSLVNANATIDEKNNGLFKSLEQKLNDPKTHDRAAIWKPKADAARSLSEAVSKYLDELKLELKQEAGLRVEDGKEVFKEDNLDAATRLMVEAPKQKGVELYQKLSDFKAQLLNLFPDPAVRAQFEHQLPLDMTTPANQDNTRISATHEDSVKSWRYNYFHMTPTVAAITILSKFQNDVKNSEAMAVDYFHRQVGEVQLVYDAFQAFAGTNSTYLMPGQELDITAGIGAFSNAAKPSITIDGASVTIGPNGTAEYKTTVGGPGSYTKKVRISYRKPDGTEGVVEKDIPYTVGSPTGASVSADKVKVLYIGLDNELSISGGNVGDERVKASIDNGELTKTSAGKYISHPSTPGKATITLTIDGKSTLFEYRVKTVPDPVAMIGKSKGGRIKANELKAQVGLRAELENFVFEGVQFNVTSFTIYATGAGFSNPAINQNIGAYFTPESKRILEKLQPGSTLVIDEIRATGPGGQSRSLPPIPFNCY